MRLLTFAGLIAFALVLQLSVFNTLPFPGGITPDLVLLVVVAVAVASGPLPGLLGGFCAGLALDLAPPVVHPAGVNALVFCLIGYVCGRAAVEVQRSAILPLVVTALGVSAGSLLFTVLGVMFGEPDVTWQAARHVLPLSVTYDVLLSPFIVYVVMRLLRMAYHGAEDPAAALARSSAPAAALWARQRAAAPREPRIRPGAGGSAGWIGLGHASGMLAASGRPAGGGGAITGGGNWRRGLQAGLPRLRFGPSKPHGPAPAARPGVFSGGSVVSGSPVRLRLRASWVSRLAAQAGKILWTRGRTPAEPRFGPARPAAGMFAPLRQPSTPRFGRRHRGTRRISVARLGAGRAAAPLRSTPSAASLPGTRPAGPAFRRGGARVFRRGRPRAFSRGRPRAFSRGSGGGPRSFSRGSPRAFSRGSPRAFSRGGARAFRHGGWLAAWWPRSLRPAFWRPGDKRTGGFR